MATSSKQPRIDVSLKLREAVEGSSWEEVIELILSSDCTNKERHWAITETVQRAPEELVVRSINDILNKCDNEQFSEVVPHLLGRCLWRCVGNVLRRNISGALHRQVVEESARQADENDFLEYILRHCFFEELEHTITHLVSRGLWESVHEVLRRGVSSEQHKWAIVQASRNAVERQFSEYILHHCTEQELEQVLTHMVERRLWNPVPSGVTTAHHVLSQIVSHEQWKAVQMFLQRKDVDISSEQYEWAVEQASRHATEYVFVRYILPVCRDEDLENVITHLALRDLWMAVGNVLGRGVSSERHRWAVEKASLCADEDSFVDYIFPHCSDEELERTIGHLLSRELWWSVGEVLGRKISTEQHRHAVEQAIRHADEKMFAIYILHHCTEEQLDQVLTHMVSRGLWEPVDSVTHSAVSVTQHILSQIVSQGLWYAVSRFFVRNISREQRWWAIDQACRHFDDDDIIVRHILPQCHAEELERVVRFFVSRGLWRQVRDMLGWGLSTETHGWAVEQASLFADERIFVDHILPQCEDKELDCVIVHLVSRGLWESVVMVLGRGVSTEQQRQAVEQASRRADNQMFAEYILPHCTEEQLEQVLTHMVSRGLWKPVDSVTHSDVSVTQHILSQIVSQGLWKAVGRFLERDISGEQLRWDVGQAISHAEDDFVLYILPQCHGDELKRAITHLVSRGMWEKVSEVLQRQDISTELHKYAVEQASIHADDVNFVTHILVHCREDELKEVLTHLLSRSLWWPVQEVLRQGKNATKHWWAVEKAATLADERSLRKLFLPLYRQNVDLFRLLVENRKWKCTRKVLRDVVRDTLRIWIISGHDRRSRDTLFWKLIHYCRVEVSLALDLTKAVTGKTSHPRNRLTTRTRQDDLPTTVSWQKELCKSLMTSLLCTVCNVMCSDGREYTDSTEHTMQCVSDIYVQIQKCIEGNTDSSDDSTHATIKKREEFIPEFTKIADTYKTDPLFLLHFLQGLNLYHDSRRGKKDDAILLVMLAVFPLFPQLQSVALRVMLREERWDVISQACLSHVWEHDRRRLFKAAVEQRQWSVVRQWSDHTVHDDEREWVMKEAFIEKQWMVYLLLADHGLTMPEQMHAHYIVAKYGDWDTVKQMVERGGDITEVSELLLNWVTGNLRKKPQGDVTVYDNRCGKLIRLRLGFAKEAVLSPLKALERGKWGSVLFNILHEPTEDYFSLVLDKLKKEKEWHILMHLVRLGMNAAERNQLFPEMLEQQQWGVCRMLLEYGVDDQLCVEALPELMERNQWTLVARVMDYDVDDAVRRQVMQCAFQRRTGALFWHCLNVMEDKQPLTKETQVKLQPLTKETQVKLQPLTKETQVKLFHQAISRDIWQAVKPLMVEKDEPVIQHREMAFLEAIEQRLWDVVDYCQLHGADINMKDGNGETPLHREARKEEWIAVKEIVLRDGKPNLLDKDGVSVLNRLIHHRQWGIVKIVIMYGGDIHLPARCSEHYGEDESKRFDEDKCERCDEDETHTPLQALIDARQADIIQFSIMWCGDQKKGLNGRGETCFHAVCDSDRWWDVMEDLIVRKVNPLAVTKAGKSPLVYAVLNTKCPERMVAECSRMGFSSHQPSVNGPQESLLHDIIRTVAWMWKYRLLKVFDDNHYLQHYSEITSPLVCAVLRDSPVLVNMLFESASCSRREVVTLYTQLPRLTDLNTEEGRTLYEEVKKLAQPSRKLKGHYLMHYHKLKNSIKKHTALLRELDTTPRTLRSSCRLLILQRFPFSDTKRHQLLDMLPLNKKSKKYLEYSDLWESKNH